MLFNTAANFEELTTNEWLVTNGIGGFASSSIVGANTRRYHGLLTASLNPPTDRCVMVAKIEECIVFKRDCIFSLSSSQYPDVVHPQGYEYFKFFGRKPFPRFKYEISGNHLLKTVFMVHGSNTTVVEYENTGEQTFKLRLNPLFVHRDYHSLYKENENHNYWVKREEGRCGIYAYFGAPPVWWAFSKGEWFENRYWVKNVTYRREEERGLDFQEDYYAIAYVDVVLQPGEKVFFTFSTDEKKVHENPETLKKQELERIENLIKPAATDSFLRDLTLAGDQFIVKRGTVGNGFSIIAGYPWFTDWGRDTMIAMRGLTIATGKQAESKSILETFLKSVDKGMLPNRFPDKGEAPEYNTIDATLWLFIALYEYRLRFQDNSIITQYFDKLTDILEHHIAGTRYGIKVTPEGFLSGGEGTVQLTWMDARVGDYVVTPRHGCPVEIQALWYNALRIYQNFAVLQSKPYQKYAAIADSLKKNFANEFVKSNGGLNDVIEYKDGHWIADNSIRPNQIYTLTLPYALLSAAQEKAVLEEVTKHLLTDYGLRTLSPDDPAFRPVYGGDQWQRDTAYHQGTVWPFLLGEYIAAYLKVNDWSETALKYTESLIEPLKKHFYQSDCSLAISEIFDGKTPLKGKGAVQQAWSIGMLLKAIIDLKEMQKKRQKKSKIPLKSISYMIF
jgi:predicted glycogen debranching enzyme